MTGEVLATVAEMQADFERTGTLAPMYARALFARLAAAEAVVKAAEEWRAADDERVLAGAHLSHGYAVPLRRLHGAAAALRAALTTWKEAEGGDATE